MWRLIGSFWVRTRRRRAGSFSNRLTREQVTIPQMTKHRGSRNYSKQESQLLLELVVSQMPKSKADWEVLAAIYNNNKSCQMSTRDAISLKRKVRSLRARAGRELSGKALWPSGLSCRTASVSQSVTPSGECWEWVKQVKQAQEVSGGRGNKTNASVQPRDKDNLHVSRHLSSLSELDEVTCRLQGRRDLAAHEVLASTKRQLSKLLKAHRRAERLHREALRECIASLTDKIL